MALELTPDEAGTRAARRIIRKQIAQALKVLSGGTPSDEDVHTARKELKKARATLRLLRSKLGRATYQRENRTLRDVARPLSEIRDAKVLLDTVDKLIAHSGTSTPTDSTDGPDQGDTRTRAEPLLHRSSSSGQDPLQQLRVEFATQRAASERKLLSGREPLKAQRNALRAVEKRSADWRVGSKGWSVIGSGLKRVYRSGRKALAAVETDRSPENLHEWRKQTKYLWHQLELLEPLKRKRIKKLAKRAHDVAELLGDDHDLAVLRTKLNTRGEHGGRTVLDLIEHREAQLQKKAVKAGRRLYKKTPNAFQSRFHKEWRGWHQ